MSKRRKGRSIRLSEAVGAKKVIIDIFSARDRERLGQVTLMLTDDFYLPEKNSCLITN